MRFQTGLKIQKYFGDFGGDYSERDTVAPGKKARAEYLEELLPSTRFEEKFNQCLQVVLPEGIEVETHTTAEGHVIYTAPSYARHYILTGYLALNLLDGYEKMVMGTYSDEIALAFAKVCKALGVGAKLCLSQAQVANQELVDQLRAQEVELDMETCVTLFDMPYCYVNFDDAAGYGIIPVEANYGPYPQAALTGLFAGLYGKDLAAAAEQLGVACTAVAITTGTEAVGVFPAMMDRGVPVVTVEETVAKEYHLEDSGCYTLSTRSADEDKPDTTICPQLANWWHQGKVRRLGCDRIFPVDTGAFDSLPLGERTKRALALIEENLDVANVLVLEEK